MIDDDQQYVWDVLSTPHNADFKQFRQEHRNVWLTKDRRLLPIKDMDTKHIISCINMLEALRQEYTAAYEGLIDELRNRGVKI
jgi:hypothetical protein